MTILRSLIGTLDASVEYHTELTDYLSSFQNAIKFGWSRILKDDQQMNRSVLLETDEDGLTTCFDWQLQTNEYEVNLDADEKSAARSLILSDGLEKAGDPDSFFDS